MKVNTIKVKWAENELKQNTHIVELEDSCVVIDAGCGVEGIREITSKPIKAVFVTHGHYDHIKDIEEYDALNVPIYASKHIVSMLNNEVNNVSSYFNKPVKYDVKNITLLEDNEIIGVNNHTIKCLHTPGHSADGMCYLIDDEILFSGDTVFSIAVGRDDLPTGNTDELIKSLNMILNLDYKALFTGHGRPSDKEEQNRNIPKWTKHLKERRTNYV